MDIPWQLCRTIGPLLSQRFLLASAKAQPRVGILSNLYYMTYFNNLSMVKMKKARVSNFPPETYHHAKNEAPSVLTGESVNNHDN